MKNSTKTILITILTAVIADVIASIIISALSNVNLIEATIKIWSWIYNLFKTILLFKIPLWFIMLLIFLIIIIINFIYKISNKNNQLKPWYSDYTSETYRDVLYSWNYTTTYSGKIDIQNFRPICTNCEGELTTVWNHGNTHYGSPRLYCPNCDKILNTPDSDEIEHARLFVFNNLKKKQKELQKDDKER